MKLYYMPGACSLASHIALHETGADFAIEAVDTRENKTASGKPYNQINAKGYVPTLVLSGGTTLTEGAAILQYIAENNPATNLMPTSVLERFRVQEYLSYFGAELHKTFTPFFASKLEGEALIAAEEKLIKRMNYVEEQLSDGRQYLVNDQYTIADIYLFVMTRWLIFLQKDIKQWPSIAALSGRIAQRPAVLSALASEGF